MAAISLPAAENLPPRLCRGLVARELLCPVRETHVLEPASVESEWRWFGAEQRRRAGICLHAGAVVCSSAWSKDKLHSSGSQGITQEQPRNGSATGTRLWVVELKMQREVQT